MAVYTANEKCYGFQERYYDKGDTVEVTAEEIKSMNPDMKKHFTRFFTKV